MSLLRLVDSATTMPTPTTFRHGYGLRDGTHVGPFIVENSEIKHIAKQPYKRYELPTQIVLVQAPRRGQQGRASAEEAVKSHLGMGSKEGKILYTAFGSPYECHCIDLTVTEQVL